MEHISYSLMCLDDMGSELFSQVADIDLDDLLIRPGIIDSPDFFCELCLREDTSSILHEVEEEFVFSS
jgi:hypothetical protein